jgi:hypothetical protein
VKKQVKYLFFLFVAAAVLIPALDAQEQRLRGISLNGSTGLYSIPTGRIGWERDSDLGLDFAYHAIINDDGTAHIPSVTLSFFKWVEFSAAFDIQPDILKDVLYWNGLQVYRETPKNDDLLFGIKLQLPTNIKNSANPALALGTNIQVINVSDEDENTLPKLDFTYTAFQIYAAATYAGTFFTMPAETTVVIGKTLYSGIDNNSDIDFGMGFDLILLPNVFQRYVHWIIDFANFDYSDNSWPNALLYRTGSPWYRGILNTGLRFDLGAIPALSKFKFLIDVVFNDLFDNENRSFTIGGAFGISIL